MFLAILFFLFILFTLGFIFERVRPYPKNILIRLFINIIFIVANLVIISYSAFYFEKIEIFQELINSLIPENIKFLENYFINRISSLLIFVPFAPMLVFTQKLWITSKKGEDVFSWIIAALILFGLIFI